MSTSSEAAKAAPKGAPKAPPARKPLPSPPPSAARLPPPTVEEVDDEPEWNPPPLSHHLGGIPTFPGFTGAPPSPSPSPFGHGFDSLQPLQAGMGRVSSPPLLREFALDERCVQFRVQRKEIGRPADLGVIGSNATTEELAAFVRAPGEYLLWPIDIHGRDIQRDPLVKILAKDHAAFRELEARQQVAQVAGPAVAMAPGLDPNALQLLTALVIKPLEQRLTVAEQALKAREEALRAKEDQVAKERLALASAQTASLTDTTNKVVDSFLDRMAAINASAEAAHKRALDAAEAAHQREMAKIKADNDARLAEIKAKAELEEKRINADLTMRKDEIAERAKEREAQARADEARRKQLLDEDRTRLERDEVRLAKFYGDADKLRAMRYENSNPMGSVQQTLELVNGLKASGLLPGGEGSGEPPTTAQVVADTIKDIFALGKDAFVAQQQAKAAMAGAMLPDDDVPEMEFEPPQAQAPAMPGMPQPRWAQAQVVPQAPQRAPQAQIPAAPAPLQLPAPGVRVDPFTQQPEPSFLRSPQAQAPMQQPQMQQPQVQAPQQVAQPQLPVTAGTVQARRVLNAGARGLLRMPRKSWPDAVLGIFMEHQAVLAPHIQAVGLRQALRETGVLPEDAVESIVQGAMQHPMLQAYQSSTNTSINWGT